MAKIVEVPDGYGLGQLRWRLDGDPEEMLCSIGVKLIPSPLSVNDAAANLADSWGTTWTESTLHEGWTFVGATMRYGPLGEGPVGESIRNDGGTASGVSIPNNCAFLVRKITGFGGRKNRGRIYLPGGYLDHTHVGSGGGIDPSEVSGAQDLMDTFFTTLTTAAAFLNPPYLFHGRDESADPDLFQPTVMTAFQVQNRIATQRRRMRP